MTARLVVAILLSTSFAWLHLSSPSPLLAKDTSYLLTGGELGVYAVQMTQFPLDGEGGEWALGERIAPMESPDAKGAVSYDLYRQYGVLAVPHQQFVTGPELRYYPGPGLMHSVWGNTWYELPKGTVDWLNGQIVRALSMKERGELTAGAFAADLRIRRMDEATFWIAAPHGKTRPEITNSNEFVLQSLVATMSNPPVEDTLAAGGDLFDIFYEAWFEDERSGFGGALGTYAAPSSRLPGRFWPAGYQGEAPYAAPYFVTTPDFDAAIADAIGRHDLQTMVTTRPQSSEASSSVLVGFLAVAIAGVALFALRLVRAPSFRRA